MISLVVILAIAVSIGLGYKTKINTGLFAIVFAYIIGCFFLDLKASEVIKMWPISIFFVILSVSLFYNFALVNGTLEKLSLYLLYKCRKFPKLLPFIIFLSSTFVAALGAGYYTVLAFFAPLTLILCEKTKMNKLVGAISVNYGALAGANFMTSGNGIVFRGLMDENGYSNVSFSYSTTIFILSFIIPVIVISGFILFGNKSTSSEKLEVEKPEPFNAKQKQNLTLIFTMVGLVLIVPILKILLPTNAAITFINSKLDVGLISIIFTVIALLMKIGDEKAVIAKVPWNTLLMICGVGMLIQVAIKAGTIDLLSSWVSSNIPVVLIPIALVLIGGCMSFFSSTIGVVCPALFPIIPTVASASGLNPMLLFAAIVIGAQATSVSPFSSGGSLVLGSCSNDEERSKMFNGLMFKAIPICLGATMVMSLITLFI
ncbi:C4-dicarboxylate ABC transporter [Candidatus Epulonipiscium fishelsonii]|uniref:C4-dicarboxylate ABC transporter n=1 Tax=Candidatus Epulonipiscium fishelsonii TaxID=77094 RepID=A0ACC8XBV9_9FIRM|nr:C4-dicarboxylate ABC transporter [Epulopiscium sp. SCG-B05WGA-EpuloA1]ONI39792.1 C4-dicarboxylate ABC transporter [Epulopiscium sp. SCG-B11WGA-EpuloA1]